MARALELRGCCLGRAHLSLQEKCRMLSVKSDDAMPWLEPSISINGSTLTEFLRRRRDCSRGFATSVKALGV